MLLGILRHISAPRLEIFKGQVVYPPEVFEHHDFQNGKMGPEIEALNRKITDTVILGEREK